MTGEEEAAAFDVARNTWETLGEVDPLWGVDTNRDFAQKGQEAVFFEQGEAEVQSVMELVRSLNPELHYGRALDFGCGVGRLTTALATRFDHVTGVDVSKPMIVLADRYRDLLEDSHAARFEFVCNSNPNLALFNDQSFDFVLSLITLQHLRPALIRPYIRELCRVTADPGVLVFQLPATREKLVKRVAAGVSRRVREFGKKRAAAGLPEMEMHGLPQQEVQEIVVEVGREITLVVPDKRAAGWDSYTYVVT